MDVLVVDVHGAVGHHGGTTTPCRFASRNAAFSADLRHVPNTRSGYLSPMAAWIWIIQALFPLTSFSCTQPACPGCCAFQRAIVHPGDPIHPP